MCVICYICYIFVGEVLLIHVPFGCVFEKLGHSRMPMEIQSRTVTMRSKCQSPTWKCFEVGTSGKDNNM